jgi:hypothetical protein
MIARKVSGQEASGSYTLRQRFGDRGVQRLMGEIAAPSKGGAQSRSPAIQAKLTVSQPGDVHEREADRVASEVMRMPDSGVRESSAVSSSANSVVQRMCTKCDDELEKKTIAPVQRKEQTGDVPPVTPSVAANIQSLRGGGRALPASTRAFFEPRFEADFSAVRVHTDERANATAKSIGAKAFTHGRDIAFASGQYSPASSEGQHLLAHELTHTIQQAATAPYVALSPDRKPGTGSSKFDGALLGVDRNGRQILVNRELGGTQGYDHRLQAVAVARLAQAEPSAVALGHNGKWHAFETIGGIVAADASAKDPRASIKPVGAHFKDVELLPTRLLIAQARQKVDELKAKVVRIGKLQLEWRTNPEYRKAVKGSDRPIPEALEEARVLTVQELNKANQTAAALILGVPESEVLSITSLSGRVAGKINIIPPQGKGVPGGGHNPLGGDIRFEEGRLSAIHFDLSEFDDPVRAQMTLFHEAQHLHDWELAQYWIKTYRAETGALFIKSAQDAFKKWLEDQVKRKRLTEADRELVIMEIGDANAYTEARANVRTFLAALQAGAPAVATKALVGYARALKPGGQYASPADKPNESRVQVALVEELRTAYQQMPTQMKQQYNAAVSAAITENPGAWISELNFSKNR